MFAMAGSSSAISIAGSSPDRGVRAQSVDRVARARRALVFRRVERRAASLEAAGVPPEQIGVAEFAREPSDWLCRTAATGKARDEWPPPSARVGIALA